MGIITVVITIITTNVYSIINSNKGLVINGNEINKPTKNNIEVYISGEVKNKGKVNLKKGDSLNKALNKAGGITENADISRLDIYRKLINGDKIIIPSKQKEQEDKVDIKEEQTEEITEEKIKININKSSKEELIKLKGIGEKTAENIIEYRERKQFEEIEEIMEVKGIGKAKFEGIKENIEI